MFAGLEPLDFTNLFPTWQADDEVADLQQQEGRQPGQTVPAEELLAKLSRSRYTWEELQDSPLPEGVDPLKLESYLEDDEFEDVLALPRDEFYGLPAWKQCNIKKEAGLF